MAHVHENRDWIIDVGAAELHADGLDFGVDQALYPEAHNAFDAALNRLNILPQTDDVLLQSARIIRDDGFTYVREGCVQSDDEESRDLFERAEDRMLQSHDMTWELLSDLKPKTARERQLFSEHGATLGTLGRMIVARQVLFGDHNSDSKVTVADLRTEQHYFGKKEAHHFLRQGNNMYYLVSNAMHGAQAERLNGKIAHVAPWLGRAAVGIARSAVYDRQNFMNSVKTAARLGRSLASKHSIEASVLTRP